MSRMATFLAAFVLAAIVFSAAPAWAQGYTPQRPVLSPWLQLEQTNTGPLDNYHTYVQPQIQLNETLRAQNAAIERQQVGLQNLSDQMISPQGRTAAMGPTGQGASFMNYGHYFPVQRTGVARPLPALSSHPAASHGAPNIGGPNVPSF
jgi:hypothetical protein